MLVDNSAAAMVIPSAMMDFLQDTNDFCFPPIIGTYLRLVRAVIFLGTLFLMPLWYLLIKNPDSVPQALHFLLINEPNEVPVLLQIILAELLIDGIKLASLNTPDALNNAFSAVGGAAVYGLYRRCGLYTAEL